ncbi:hypothetical protein OIO90_001919 [Microbotryomycetes sp. JL221]|nr:hypothetical protein OIO90_001919 [Microbotryomycetes sp. JL221]
MSLSVLPPPYYVFFTLVEPGLTVGGVVYAVFQPVAYLDSLVPPSTPLLQTGSHVIDKVFKPHATQNAIMATRQLGSCFFLLALLASVCFKSICHQLDPVKIKHDSQGLKDVVIQHQKFETIVANYLWCLAVADLTHIGFTLYDLGSTYAFDPSTWTTLVWGNVGITSVLFLVRSLWFAGIGRTSYIVNSKKKRQ